MVRVENERSAYCDDVVGGALVVAQHRDGRAFVRVVNHVRHEPRAGRIEYFEYFELEN